MLILFDHGTPKGLIRALPGHTVITAQSRGWDMVKKFVESLVLRTTFDVYGIPGGLLLSDSTIARAHNRRPKYKLAHDA